MTPIERRRAPSVREFRRRYASASRPVVLTDAMDGWAARRTWTFDWLASRYGSQLVPVKVAFYLQRRLPLAEYLDVVQGKGPHAGSLAYLSNLDLSREVPELRHDFSFPAYHWLDRLAYYNFWIGPRGTLSNLHCDYAHNLLAQVVGRKRVLLYSPAKTPLLGPEKTTFYSSFSGYDCATATGDRPAIPGDVEPDHDLELSAGEMLFIPLGWWHRVRSLQPSISINRWWWTPRMTLTQGAGMVSLLVRQRLFKPAPTPTLDDETCRLIAGLAHTRRVSPMRLVRLAAAELAARQGVAIDGLARRTSGGDAALVSIARRIDLSPVQLVTASIAELARTSAIEDHEGASDPALLDEIRREIGPLFV